MDEYLSDVFEFITDVGVNILNDFESVKPKRKRLIKASELCIPSIISEDETEKRLAFDISSISK